MTGSARIEYVEGALLTLLRTNMPVAYGAAVDIQPLGGADFDDNGRLIIRPPALRVRFQGTTFANLRDNQRLTYEASHTFDILCFQSSLHSKADERVQTLGLVAVVLNQIAGTRLTLQDATTTLPVSLRGIVLVETEELPVDQHYAVRVSIEGPAQFDGPNANFPGSGT